MIDQFGRYVPNNEADVDIIKQLPINPKPNEVAWVDLKTPGAGLRMVFNDTINDWVVMGGYSCPNIRQPIQTMTSTE